MVIKLHVNRMAIVGERFDYRNDIIKGKDYSKIIRDEGEISGDIVSIGMKGYEENSRFNRASLALMRKSMMPSDFENTNEKAEFYCAEANIFGEEGEDIDVDGIVKRFAMREPFLIRLGFIEHDCESEGYATAKYVEKDMETDDEYDSETEFLSMMKEWYYTFKRLEDNDKLTDEERMGQVQKLEFAVEFTNTAGKTVNGRFGVCTLLGMDDERRLVVVVDKFDIYNF